MRKFLTIMLAAFGLLLLAGCSDSPKDVTKNWMQALVDGDVEKANEYSTSNVHLVNAILVESLKGEADKKAEAKKSLEKIDSAREEIDGDTAKVFVEGDDDPITLKKVDGEWKVDIKK